jgi:Cu(I)/Ag(I) efflux system membrane fusion protein/cobalt-zinc-cadmium efflux system membrane fusion protein
MKKIIITIVLGMAIGFGAGYFYFRTPAGEKAGQSAAQTESTTGKRKIAYYKDPMHPWYTSDKPGKAPDCGMDLVPVYEGDEETGAIKIDPVTVQNIGVKTEEVTTRDMSRIIRAPGKIETDERRVYSVNCKVSGWVEKLFIDYTGMLVRRGQPLMEIYSPELVAAQEEYLQAISYHKRLEERGATEAGQGAEQLLESARKRLLNWDITPAEIKALEERGTVSKNMTIYSPADGIVTAKMVFKGQNVAAGMELYKIADLSAVWAMASIYQYEIFWLKVGQPAKIEVSYQKGKVFDGKISYVYPDLAADTKTGMIRVELHNSPGLDLKPGMFVSVAIELPSVKKAVAVPEQAIIRSGERNIAIMALGGGYFEPREVRLGISAGSYVEVLEGIREGEKIVVSSQFLIDSESNLKAAIGQMSGHEGMDMSRPMTGQKIAPGKPETKAQEMAPGQEMKMDTSQQQSPVKPAVKQLYTCVMHPEVLSDKPGNCPKCGMKLVPKK